MYQINVTIPKFLLVDYSQLSNEALLEIANATNKQE